MCQNGEKVPTNKTNIQGRPLYMQWRGNITQKQKLSTLSGMLNYSEKRYTL